MTTQHSEMSEAERAADDATPFDEQGGITDGSIPGEDSIAADETARKTFELGVSILTENQLMALLAPLNPARVANLKGNAYLKAWDVKAALIKVFGFGGFSADVIESSIVSVREHAAGMTWHVKKRNGQEEPATPQVIAKATVRLTVYGIGPRGEDVTYTESAIGANSGSDIGDTMDNALKTASSAALKRCAIYLGTQFGLSLYNNGDTRDYVGRVLSPWQDATSTRIRDERAERAQAQVQDQLERATQR